MAKKFTHSVIILWVLCASIALAGTVVIGREGTVNFLSGLISGKRAHELVSDAISPVRFFALQGILLMAFMLGLFLIRVREKATQTVSGLYQGGAPLVMGTWRSIIIGPGNWLLLTPFLVTLYGIIFIPVSFDEAITYFDFTSRGPLVAISYYPYPNNHVLHSLLTSLTFHLPLPALVSMRILPVAVSLLSNAVCLYVMTRLYGKQMAWVITAIHSVLFFSIYYGYMSRGYYLVTLGFILCFYCAERIARGDARKRHQVAFVIASIAGFFTMPSFLYPFVTLCAYMVLRRTRALRTVIVSGLIIVPAVVALYLPIILANGLSALTSNPYVKPVTRGEVLSQLPAFLGSSITEMTGIHWIWTVAFLMIATVYAVINRRRHHLRDMAFFLAMPAIIVLGHSVVPYPRTFCYYTILLTLMTFLPYTSLFASLKPARLIPALVFIQVLLCWNFVRIIEPYEERDPQVNFSAWKINKNILGKDKKYFCSGALMGTNLRFELETGLGLKDRITFADIPVNTDTLRGYDHIIVGRLMDSTINRPAEYATPYFTVYGRGSEAGK